MANLELINIGKTYPNGYEAIGSINVNIDAGQFVVIVGPSGCGKSTLLRMVAGLETTTSGTLKIAGRDVTQTEAAKRDIAMVFQNYALYPHMSVFNNMAYGLKISKMPKEEIKQRVNQAAKMLGLEQLLERKPKQLSGGQRQRVAMGRAVVRSPKLFLFDEPLSNLDAKLRVQMRLEIQKLHRQIKTTSLYVTHDQVEAMTLADQIIVLNKGAIEQVGTPVEIFDVPASVFVAQFMGSPPMNILPVSISATGQIICADQSILACEQQIKKEWWGKNLLLGIRPEHMNLSQDGITARTEMVETLGSEQLIHLSVENIPLVIRQGGNEFSAKLGECVKINVNHPQQLHWFDAQTEKRIETNLIWDK